MISFHKLLYVLFKNNLQCLHSNGLSIIIKTWSDFNFFFKSHILKIYRLCTEQVYDTPTIFEWYA